VSAHDCSETQASNPNPTRKQRGKIHLERGKLTGEQIRVDQHVAASSVSLSHTKKRRRGEARLGTLARGERRRRAGRSAMVCVVAQAGELGVPI
jgi:hypothetical protein